MIVYFGHNLEGPCRTECCGPLRLLRSKGEKVVTDPFVTIGLLPNCYGGGRGGALSSSEKADRKGTAETFFFPDPPPATSFFFFSKVGNNFRGRQIAKEELVLVFENMAVARES